MGTKTRTASRGIASMLFACAAHALVSVACAGDLALEPHVAIEALDPPEARALDIVAARAAVEHSAGGLAGALDGDIAVGPSGQLTYTIPIDVAPGRNGMEPTISLSYSSTTGNGPLGVSWSLNGYSQVSRCRRSVHLDGRGSGRTSSALPDPAADGVDFDADDAFCLDGDRLEPVDAAQREYRTRRDRYARITRLGGVPMETTGWVVENRDGTVSCYGSGDHPYCVGAGAGATVTGAIYDFDPMAPEDFDPDTESRGTSAWMVARVSDRTGNSVIYIYNESAPSTDSFALDHRPIEIRYTSLISGVTALAGTRRVVFSYEDRPDHVSTFADGLHYLIEQRLRRVAVYAPPPGSDGSTTEGWWSYELSYEAEPHTGRSRLQSITRCDGNFLAAPGATPTSCLPPTVLTYENVAEDWVVKATGIRAGADPNLETQAQVGDLDGDGRDDLVFYRGWISECAESQNGDVWSVPWDRVRRAPGPGATPVAPPPLEAALAYVQDPQLYGTPCAADPGDRGSLAYRGSWHVAFGDSGNGLAAERSLDDAGFAVRFRHRAPTYGERCESDANLCDPGLECLRDLGCLEGPGDPPCPARCRVPLTTVGSVGENVALGNPSFPYAGHYIAPSVLDLTRDGIADVVGRYSDVTRGGTAPVMSLTTRAVVAAGRIGLGPSLFERRGTFDSIYWGDFDGDGLPDSFGVNAAEFTDAGTGRLTGRASAWRTRLSGEGADTYLDGVGTTVGLAEGTDPFVSFVFGDARIATYVVDIDGDGLDDVVYPTSSTPDSTPRSDLVALQYQAWSLDSTGGRTTRSINLEQDLTDVASFNADLSTWQTLRRFADVNGDGLADFVSFGGAAPGAAGVCPNTLCVRYNSGRAFGPWTPLMATGASYEVPRQLRPARLPHTERPDSFFRPVNDDGIRVLDWNGDGRADFLVPSVSGSGPTRTFTTRLYLSGAAGYRLATTGTPSLGNGTIGFLEPSTGLYNPLGDIRHECPVGGRCCDDFRDCEISDGTGLGVCYNGSHQCTTTVEMCASFNRCDDGNACSADYCRSDTIPGTCNTIIGDCVDPHAVPQIVGYSARVGDFDGDGLQDLAYLDYSRASGTNGAEWVIQLRRGRRGSLLRAVTNGLGASDTARWESTTNRLVYSPGDVAAYHGTPRRSHRGGLQVVAELRRGDAAGSLGAYFYSYGDGIEDVEGAGFLGFRQTQSFEGNRVVRTVTTFAPDALASDVPSDAVDAAAYWQLGIPVSTETFHPLLPATTGTRVLRTESTFRPRFRANHVYEVLPETVRDELTETRPGVVSTDRIVHSTTFPSGFDQFGNPPSVEVATSGVRRGVTEFGDVLRTDNIYENRQAEWLIGLTVYTTLTSTVAASGRAGDPAPGTHASSVSRASTFDTLGRLDSETRGPGTPAEITTRLGYDPTFGVVTSASATTSALEPGTGTRTRTMLIEHDEEHYHPRRFINALGHVSTTVIHPAFGVSVVARDPNNLRATTRIDALGRTVYVSAPGTTPLTTRYTDGAIGVGTAAALTIQLRQVGHQYVDISLDYLGRERQRDEVVGRELVTTDLEYDSASRVRSISEPHPTTEAARDFTTATYDSLDRTTRVVRPDGTAVTASYGLFDTTTTNARGMTTTARIDINGRGVEVEERLQDIGSTSVRSLFSRSAYGAFGRLRWSEDDDGYDTIYGYDAFGRMERMVDPDAGTRRFTYDAFDDLILSVNGAGDRTEYFRDPLGRIEHSRETDSGGTTVESFFTWDETPDPARGRTWIGEIHASRRDAPDNVTTQTYFDEFGRPSSEDVIYGGSRLTMDYVYDSAARLREVVYPAAPSSSGTPVRYRARYDYDDSGRVRRITGISGFIGTVLLDVRLRDARGAITSEAAGNSVVTRREFDTMGRLTTMGVQSVDAGGTPVTTFMALSYGYDSDGNVTSRTEEAVGVTRRDEFALDSLDRLRRWTLCTSAGRASPCTAARLRRETTYSYDDIGNLARAGSRYGAIGTTTPPSTNEVYTSEAARPHTLDRSTLTTVGGATIATDYELDAAGRRTRDAGRLLSYGTEDLPRTIVDSTGTTSYSYDAGGHRAVRVEGGQVTRYMGDLFEAGPQSSIAHVMGPGGPVASVVLSSAGPQPVYHHRDVLGSSSVTTSQRGLLIERQHFEPFGSLVDVNGLPTNRPSSPINDSFTGHELDRTTGYVNAEGRIYDPRTRRFLTSDPLAGLAGSQSWNPFSYVENNPSTYTDPSGFDLDPGVQGTDSPSEGPPNMGPEEGTWEGRGILNGNHLQYEGSGSRASDAPTRSTRGSGRVDDVSSSGPSRVDGSWTGGPVRTPSAIDGTGGPPRVAEGGDVVEAAISGAIDGAATGAVLGYAGGYVVGALAAAGPVGWAVLGVGSIALGAYAAYELYTHWGDITGTLGRIYNGTGTPDDYYNTTSALAGFVSGGVAFRSGMTAGAARGPAVQRFLESELGHLRDLVADEGGSIGRGARLSTRVGKLRRSIPANSRGRITLALGLAEDPEGALRLLLGTSEPGGYLRPGVTVGRAVTVVRGLGHAEADIVAYARQQGLRLLEVGATRPICAGCARLLGRAGALAVTPLKGR